MLLSPTPVKRPLYTKEYLYHVLQHSGRMTSVVWSRVPFDILDNLGDQLAELILDPKLPNRNTDLLFPGKVSVACVARKTWVLACRRIWFKDEIILHTIEDIHQLHRIVQHPLPAHLPELFTTIKLRVSSDMRRPFDRRWAWSVASLMGYLPSLRDVSLSGESNSSLFWTFQPHYPDFRHIQSLALTRCRFHSFSVFARQISAMSSLSQLVCSQVHFVAGDPPLQLPSRVQASKNVIHLAVYDCKAHWPFVYFLAASAFCHDRSRAKSLAAAEILQQEEELLSILRVVKLLEQTDGINWTPRHFWGREIGGDIELLVTSDEVFWTGFWARLRTNPFPPSPPKPTEHSIAFCIKRHSNAGDVMDALHATADTNAPHLCRLSVYYSYAHAVGWKTLNSVLTSIRQPFSLEVIHSASFSTSEYSRLLRETGSGMPNVNVFLTSANFPKLRLPRNLDDEVDLDTEDEQPWQYVSTGGSARSMVPYRDRPRPAEPSPEIRIAASARLRHTQGTKGALLSRLRDVSTHLIAALPPPQVSMDLDLRLNVLDLEQVMTRLEALEEVAPELRDTEWAQVKRQREEEVLRLQRSAATHAGLERAGDRFDASRESFDLALEKIRVRLRLYDQLDALKIEGSA